MLINVVARDRGWLFEDLKRHLVRIADRAVEAEDPVVSARVADMSRFPVINEPQFRLGLSETASKPVVLASEFAYPKADAWIYIRTAEAVDSPDLWRTVVQIHDLWTDPPHDYGPESPRGIAARECRAISFTHPAQIRGLDTGSDGFHPMRHPKTILCRPIGALEAFTPRTEADQQEIFTVGWAGRPTMYQGREIKRVEMFVEAIRLLRSPVRAIMPGDGLDRYIAELRAAGVEAPRTPREYAGHWEEFAPPLFRQMDAFVATSESPAVPLACYEALSSGVPVVSTPREWTVDDKGAAFPAIVTADSARDIATALATIRAAREEYLARSKDIAATQPWTLESWCEENLRMAAKLTEAR